MSSSRRSSSRKRSSSILKSNKLTRSNNVQLLKLIDPIVQSILFIVFLYCLDAQSRLDYRQVILITLAWQLLSGFCNLALNDPKQFRFQRMAFMVLAGIFLLMYFFIQKHAPDVKFDPNGDLKQTFSLKEIVLMTTALVLAFWYNIICYREIRAILGGVINRGRGK